MPSRRTLLASTASLALPALAGCSSISDPLSDEEKYEYSLYLEEVDSITAHALWKPGQLQETTDEQRAAWKAATSGDSYVTHGYRPIPDEDYTERDGTYYRIRSEVTGQKRIERSILRLRWVGDEDQMDDPPKATVIDDLPDVDRSAAFFAFTAARSRHGGGGAPWDAIEHGGTVYRRRDPEESELVPKPEHEYLSQYGTILRVEVVQKELLEPEYTTTAMEVADSKSAFTQIADAASVDARVDSSSLSKDARRILDDVTAGETHSETKPLSKEFEAVFRALDLRDYIHHSGDRLTSTNQWYVELDDEYHQCSVTVDDT